MLVYVPPPAVELPVQNSPAMHPDVELEVVDPLVVNVDKFGRTFVVVAEFANTGEDIKRKTTSQRISRSTRCLEFVLKNLQRLFSGPQLL